MDLDLLKEGFDFVKTGLLLLKQGKDLIPDSDKKQEAEKALMEAEKKISAGEAKIAKELGYEIHRCTWPPQIMLLTGEEKHWKCPKCGDEIHREAAGSVKPISIVPNPKRKGRLFH